MSFAACIAYIAALGIAAAIPGPGIAALVGRALGSGFSRTFPMLVGLALGDVVYLTLAVGGLAVVAKLFSGVFLFIKLAGAAYLLWLAWRFWTYGIEVQEVKASRNQRDMLKSFLAGLTVTLGNPKTIVFYMAILPAVMDLQQISFQGYLVLVALTFAILFVVLTPYIAVAARVRHTFTNRDGLRRLGKAAGGILAGTAGWIVVRG